MVMGGVNRNHEEVEIIDGVRKSDVQVLGERATDNAIRLCPRLNARGVGKRNVTSIPSHGNETAGRGGEFDFVVPVSHVGQLKQIIEADVAIIVEARRHARALRLDNRGGRKIYL